MISVKDVKIAYVTNALPNSGVGLRAQQIKKLLEERGIKVDEFYLNGGSGELKKNGEVIGRIRKWPGVFGTKTFGWLRLGGLGKKEILKGEYDLVHLTNQTLSFLVTQLLPTVVTVHDIIEVLEPQQRLSGMVNKYLYSGIKKANHIITVSKYTAREVKKYYGVAEKKISVSYNGVDDKFNVIDVFSATVGYQTLKRELGLSDASKVVLYVGSDHPRKNVVTAVKAFAKARKKEKNLVFIKVGKPGIAIEREKLLKEIDRLSVRKFVRFVGHVSNERLNELYNLADMLIYPSRFEGFGLPPLQAMACGTIVITSDVTSLPEVVGDNDKFGEQVALVREPSDVNGFADDILKVINDGEPVNSLRRKGVERAKRFDWQKASEDVIDVYARVVK
jgi:glycosyltransferase involved in cell wall biosynthesis